MIDNLLDNEIPTESTIPTQKGETAKMKGKPTNLPEKFWDTEKKAIRIEALVNSYVALEKRLSNSLNAPETEEDKFNILRKMGMPETPEEYQVDVSHGMFEADQEVNSRLHKCGCTPEQVQEFYNIAADKFAPMITQLANEFQADREVEKLVEYFGGPEKWREVSRQLMAFGQKNMPENVLDNMASSFEGVLALYKMMQGEEPKLGQSTAMSTAPEGEDELRQMMKDPRYWREKNPVYVKKVTEGFKKIYSE